MARNVGQGDLGPTLTNGHVGDDPLVNSELDPENPWNFVESDLPSHIWQGLCELLEGIIINGENPY